MNTSASNIKRLAHCALWIAMVCSTPFAQSVPFVLPVQTPSGPRGPVAPLGDLDGDGIPEFLVAVPGGTPSAPETGLVLVVSGNGGGIVHLLQAAPADQEFGSAVAPVGDLDGDGAPDFVVGAPGTGTSTQAGRVHAYSGASAQHLWTAVGSMPADGFGHALARFGDQDGDGVPDVFVGAPRDGTSAPLAGRCAVLSGVDGHVLVESFGANAGDMQGWAVSAASPGHILSHDPEPWVGLTQAGNGGAGMALRLSPSDLSVLAVVPGPQALDRFGASLTVLGDIDGDGIVDVLIGSDPMDATDTPTRPGFARVYSGADSALVREHASLVLGTGYGTTLAALGDVDGDDVPDYAIGEPLNDDGAPDAGALHVISGADGSIKSSLLGAAAGLHLGAHASGIGDVDGDGLQDLLTCSRDSTTETTWVTCISFTPWESLSNGTSGTHGIPKLIGRGGLLPDSQVSLILSQALENTGVTLCLGTQLVVDPVQGVVSPLPSDVIPLTTGESGCAQFDFSWPGGMPAGTKVYYQMRVEDPTGTAGEALSGTLSATAPGAVP